MARNIPLSGIGDYAGEQYERLLRVVVVETDRRVKQATPVDTGRLRASWQIGENAAPGGNKPKRQYPASLLPAERLNYLQEKAGNFYSVHNNVEYAEPRLTGRGGSRKNQYQRGYIPTIVSKDIADFARAAADRIGRQS